MTKNNISSRHLYLILTIIVGLIAVIPQILYQPFLLQGDHGRDLYSYQQTANGAIPHLDYKTENGPLMPYYYALFLNFFGSSIQNVLAGYALLILVAGIIIFLIASKHLTPFMAFLTALWYWTWRGEEFFYTFNHIGALTTGLIVLMLAMKLIRDDNNQRFFFSGIFWSIVTFLIRPDIGLATLAGLLICSLLYQRNSILRNRSLLVISSVSIAGSLILLNVFIPQMMNPYWHSIEWSKFLNNFINLFNLWFSFSTQNLIMSILSSFMVLLVINGVVNLFKRKNEEEATNRLKVLSCILIFMVFFSAEYLLGSRFFRWVWMMPFIFLAIFYVIEFGYQRLSNWLKIFISSTLIILCVGLILIQYVQLKVSKQNEALLEINQTHLLMQSDQKQWIDTVTKTTQLIEQHTAKDDLILTLPYDSLYCFLAQRQLASKRSYLFGFNTNILVNSIEKQQVKLIIVSNRAYFHNEMERFGVLGREYGQGFDEYLNRNYQLIAQFGPWEKMASAVFNHATRVYLRKTPFNNSQILTFK